MLQDRVVKELRLRGISTIDAANAHAPAFIASYNAHFTKPPKCAFDAHRPLRDNEGPDANLAWREPRRVTKSLTLQYDRVIYLLEETPANRKLVHCYIDVWAYSDERIKVRATELKADIYLAIATTFKNGLDMHIRAFCDRT